MHIHRYDRRFELKRLGKSNQAITNIKTYFVFRTTKNTISNPLLNSFVLLHSLFDSSCFLRCMLFFITFKRLFMFVCQQLFSVSLFKVAIDCLSVYGTYKRCKTFANKNWMKNWNHERMHCNHWIFGVCNMTKNIWMKYCEELKKKTCSIARDKVKQHEWCMFIKYFRPSCILTEQMLPFGRWWHEVTTVYERQYSKKTSHTRRAFQSVWIRWIFSMHKHYAITNASDDLTSVTNETQFNKSKRQ